MNFSVKNLSHLIIKRQNSRIAALKKDFFHTEEASEQRTNKTSGRVDTAP